MNSARDSRFHRTCLLFLLALTACAEPTVFLGSDRETSTDSTSVDPGDAPDSEDQEYESDADTGSDNFAGNPDDHSDSDTDAEDENLRDSDKDEGDKGVSRDSDIDDGDVDATEDTDADAPHA